MAVDEAMRGRRIRQRMIRLNLKHLARLERNAGIRGRARPRHRRKRRRRRGPA